MTMLGASPSARAVARLAQSRHVRVAELEHQRRLNRELDCSPRERLLARPRVARPCPNSPALRRMSPAHDQAHLAT